MPIYEYRCHDCGNRTSVFVKSMRSTVDAVCSSCGSKELVRLISSFGISKTVQSVHESSTAGDYYKDPRNIGRWAENKFTEMGMDVPSEVRGMIDAARDGQMPDSVKDLQPNVNEI